MSDQVFSSNSSAASGRRVAWLLAWASALVGCGEPSLEIRFQAPEDYRVDVRGVILRVLEPSELEPFSCDDIAFQRVSQETLDASLLQEVFARRDQSLDLDGIPRTGQKLFWIEGRDAQDIPVVAGCEAFGDIEGADSVTVRGYPTAVVTSAMIDIVGTALPESVDIYVTDSYGAALSDVEIAYTVVGPGDLRIAGTARTEAGAAVVAPGPLDIEGPTLLDIHARWQRIGPSPFTGFQSPEPLLEVDLPGNVGDQGLLRTESLYTVGPIGPQGEMGFVALGPPDAATGDRIALFAYYDPSAGAEPFRMVTSAPIANATAVGRLALDERDMVVVAAGLSWHELTPTGTLQSLLVTGRVTTRLVAIGSCERDATRVLAVFPGVGDGDDLAVFDTTGDMVPSVFSNVPFSQFLATGCVSGIDDSLHRTAVFHVDGPVRAWVADVDGARFGEIVSFSSGIGFTPAMGAEPASILGMSIDIGGSSISRYLLAVGGGNEIEPVLIDQDPTLTFVRSLGGGDVDGDGRADVAALLDFGLLDEDRSQVRMQVVLGTEYRGQRLVGISPEFLVRDPQLFTADFDDDGKTDILLAGRSSVLLLPGIAR